MYRTVTAVLRYVLNCCQISLDRLCLSGVKGPWTTWSECSVTCGGGYRSRTRGPIRVHGTAQQFSACNLQPCGKSKATHTVSITGLHLILLLWLFFFFIIYIFFFTSGDSQACPPGQQWSRCVIGAVSCTDVSMDLSRNCTPGCQCPQGRVQQVCKKPSLTPQLGDSIRSYRSDRSSFSQPPGRCVCARVWLSLQRGGTAIPTRRRCPYRLQ